MKRTKAQEAERQEAITQLRDWFPPGSTVYTILRHVSRSGMLREIGVVAIGADGDTRHPNWATAKACGYTLGKSDGVKVGGCGMDMGFAVAYNISATIWPEYRCPGKDCPSNAHQYDRETKTCPPKDGKTMHHDGYALRHRWL